MNLQSQIIARFSQSFVCLSLATVFVASVFVFVVGGNAQPITKLKPTFSTAVKSDVSPALSTLPLSAGTKKKEKGNDDLGSGPINDTKHDADPTVQRWFKNDLFNRDNPAVIPPTIVSFNGLTQASGPTPPDTVGDVSSNFYVQMVNSRLQVFSKTGVSLFGPVAINSLWAGFGGACQTENAGDPVVIHDQLADRWLITQFTAAGPTYFNCVALSTTNNPGGTYFRWAFTTGTNFPDYPKYGVWSDGYYISTREFLAAGGFAGVGAYVLNREQMLLGNASPQVVSFILPPGAQSFRTGDGLLPTDLDGNTLPPVGSPNYFVGSMDAGGPYAAPADALNLFKFSVNWTTPASSSFTFANQIPVAAFDSVFPCTPSARACIAQPGTTNKLDILSYRQRPLHRLAYRNFGTHESLVTNQSVEAMTGIAGVRWWEIRSPNSSPTIFQEGTYSPDNVNRWMGSIAMDRLGNMMLGYSVADATSVSPGIRYTGRLVADTIGTMPQGEGVMVAGSGVQTGSNRWGDYSSMNIDPIDDCTFWYTTQYFAVTSSSGWASRISSARFPGCLAPTASGIEISGRVTSNTGRALSNINLRLTPTGGGEISFARTNPTGFYRFVNIPAGENYTITANTKRYTFAPRLILPSSNLTGIDFIAETFFARNNK